MMEHIRPTTLEAFQDGELPAAEALAVEDHLRECERCRREAETLRRVTTAVRRARTLDPQRVDLDGFAARVTRQAAARPARMPSWWQRFSLKWTVEWGMLQRGAAVAAVLAVLAGGGIFWQTGSGPEGPLPPAARIEYIEPGEGADVMVLSDPDAAVVWISAAETG
jgi:anti-sigma factor RsiW